MTQTGKASVMVVDDQPANLKLLEDMLKNQGYAIRSFPRGQLALASAAQSPPDLILLDINMPQMNGFEVCERLKSDPKLAGIPVIFLSALTESDDKIKAFRCGGVDYVTKPFQIAEALARVETHLELLRLQRTIARHSDHLEAMVRTRTTELVDANAQLKLLAEALKASPNAIGITDASGCLVWTNPGFSDLSGYSAEEVIGKNRRLLNSGQQDEKFYQQMWTTISSGKVWQGEIVNRRKDGSNSTEEMIIAPVSLAPSHTTHFVTINQDISQRKRSEEELRKAEEKYRAIFEDAVVGIFRIAPDGRLLDVNRAFARMHGYDSAVDLLAEAATVPQPIFVDVEQINAWAEALDSDGVVCGSEVKIARRDGTGKWGLVNLRVVRDSDGDVGFYEGTIEDITDRKVAQQEVHFLAYYDVLTELPNRALLRARLDKALADARRRTDKVALLFLDLDRFKTINDSLGYSFGDLLLQQVAGRLQNATREKDTVARVGGDEFVIVLTCANDLEDIAAAAERVLKSVTDQFVIQGQALKITCSLGISIFPEHGSDSETLIKNADAAMYSAKEMDVTTSASLPTILTPGLWSA